MATDLAALAAEESPDEGWSTVPIPTDFETPAETSTDDSMSCVVCGKDVSHLYKRRVKNPKCEEHKSGGASKLGTGRRSSGKDVDAAVAALDSWYNLLTLGLMMGGAQRAAGLLADSTGADFQSKNRAYLEQAPALAKKIADMGKTSATYGFFSAQAMVVLPVAVLATGELMEKWGSPKKPKTPEDFPVEVPATMGGFPVE